MSENEKAIQGKKKANNGYYWANILLNDNKGKCIMLQLSTAPECEFIGFSNSSRVKNDPTWKPLAEKAGWYYKKLNASEVVIF